MVPNLPSFNFEILYLPKVCKCVREWGSHVHYMRERGMQALRTLTRTLGTKLIGKIHFMKLTIY